MTGRTGRRALIVAAAAALACIAGVARAHGERGHARKEGTLPKEQKPWGIAGDAKAARRTVEVRMADTMRFSPERIAVRLGETVRLRVHNAGKAMHEFVIGTREENEAHAELMRRFPDMEHDEPWMAHVEPGSTGEIVWTFNRAGEFEFACLIAGHYDAGMVGRITVTASAKPGGTK